MRITTSWLPELHTRTGFISTHMYMPDLRICANISLFISVWLQAAHSDTLLITAKLQSINIYLTPVSKCTSFIYLSDAVIQSDL